MNIAAPGVDTVAGSLTEEVRRRSPLVAAALDPQEALVRSRAWAEREAPDALVGAVRIESALYRPDGACTARYRVRLAPPRRERLLLVEVPPSATGIVVRAFPADPALPTLGRVLDPVLMRAVLGRVVPGTGGSRAIGRCAVDVVHYPRQGRCVLRYRLSPGAAGWGELRHPVVFGKVYGDSSASATASNLRTLRAGIRRLPESMRVAVPRPLAVVPGLRLGLTEEIPGRALLPDLVKAAARLGSPPCPDADGTLSAAVRTAGRMAAAVHACSWADLPLRIRDLAAERAATERELTLLEPVWPAVAAHLRRSAARAVEAAGAAEGPRTPVLAHGDLTPSQVLLDAAARAGLVDVDTLCIAEPALDLGRFLAYLHVTGIRRNPGAWPLLTELTAIFVAAYREACLDVDPPPGGAPPLSSDAARLLTQRTAAYRALALARLGASACWHMKDDRLAAVLDVIDAGNDWMGSVAG